MHLLGVIGKIKTKTKHIEMILITKPLFTHPWSKTFCSCGVLLQIGCNSEECWYWWLLLNRDLITVGQFFSGMFDLSANEICHSVTQPMS